jgi:hypothetical protein
MLKEVRMKYEPKPIDTSEIILPDGILEIVEVLAQNTHDVWAARKIKEGYTYESSQGNMTHSSLVPYEELSELQKEYDRATLLETIRLLIKLGYDIQKRS